MAVTANDLECPVCIEEDGELVFIPAGDEITLSDGSVITADFDVFQCGCCEAVNTATSVYEYNEISESDFINIQLSAVAGDNSVSLSWELLNVEQSSALVYRSDSDDFDESAQIASISDATLSYTDATAVNDSTYYYWIEVTDPDSEVFTTGPAEATPSASE